MFCVFEFLIDYGHDQYILFTNNFSCCQRRSQTYHKLEKFRNDDNPVKMYPGLHWKTQLVPQSTCELYVIKSRMTQSCLLKAKRTMGNQVEQIS